ncbi:MAG: hypothetical protein HY725_22620 [Candidatus Rokubacteria bacterium]|nr:hypothetical protein [Candidatus Rokubacteria bacterium]
MTAVLTLLLRHGRALAKLMRDREGAKLAVIGVFVLLFGLVMIAEYAVFRRGLAEVLDMGAPAGALTLYILESFSILVLVIAVISFVVTGLWTFYRSSDTPFLLATPLSLTQLFWLRAAETFALTSWPFVILGIPAILALGSAYRQSAGFYGRALVILILFMALAGGTGILLTMLAGAAFRRYRARTGILLATAILVGGFAFLVGRHVIPSAGDFYLIFEPGIPNGKPASLKFIEKRFWLWPSHPLAVSLYASATESSAGSEASRAAVWLLPGAALAAAGTLGRRLFRITLPGMAEGFGFSGAPGSRAAAGVGVFPRFLSGPIGALVERDLVGLGRSPQELGRAAFIAFLLVLYTAILFVAPISELLDKPETVARLLSLDLVAVGYFLTAFGLRFVFPSVSLEGRGAWILFASPVPIFGLFLAKLFAYSAVLLVVVGPIALAGALRLISSPLLLGAFALLLALLTVTTVAACLAVGLLWPNFKETNAERLATNSGGLATIILCLGYVAVVGWLGRQSVLTFFGMEAALPYSVVLYVGGAVVLSAAIVAGATAAARRRIKRLEIV